jgi:hypothetical protein
MIREPTQYQQHVQHRLIARPKSQGLICISKTLQTPSVLTVRTRTVSGSISGRGLTPLEKENPNERAGNILWYVVCASIGDWDLPRYHGHASYDAHALARPAKRYHARLFIILADLYPRLTRTIVLKEHLPSHWAKSP